MSIQSISKHGWHARQALEPRSFRCGYCGDQVASEKGYYLATHGDGSGGPVGAILICPRCNYPTLFLPNGDQHPGEAIGRDVQHVPDDVEALYREARRSATEGCHTGAVLLCRKILMNLAVSLGAKPDLKFIEYVQYLSDQGYVPPRGKHWVDHIRKKGNEATHEIALMTAGDSKELLMFIEMLLRFIYEFPALAPAGA
jgi:hypothetical protein